ncbi:MAG TPA: molybdopterin dinucleotide binding domain-containing protein [Bryobacteraceae bacterium]|nr:molybdopterin dinucleotide binding domain-containing protein [Bryobacteraceae bacterium]
MSISRRDVFKFGAGSAAGLALTPLPWKLLDDSSIWTQNWSWVPKVPRGEIRTKYSACTLCPAGCGLKARCVGEQPVSLAGVPAHPVSGGRLCPLGVTAHHVGFHPKRIRRAFRRLQQGDRYACVPARVEDVTAAVAQAIQKGSRVVVLDGRPERTTSLIYRRAAASMPSAAYVPVPSDEGATLRAVAELAGAAPGTLAFDWARARTVLSFGTPLLDGWGGPGQQLEGKRLIQVEPFLSRTAGRADRWLAAKPGTEAYVALGIAQIVADKGTPLAEVAGVTGISKEELEAVAREFSDQGPSIAIADGGYSPEEVRAVAALNLISGCIVRRAEVPLPAGFENLPAASELASLPDGAIQVLIAVEPYGLPSGLVKRKLAKDALVVTLASCLGGLTRRADYVVPVPATLEAVCDTGAPAGASLAAFGVAPALMAAPEGVADAAAFLGSLAPGLPTAPALLQARAEAIHKSGRGQLFRFASGEASPVKDVSAEDFWTALSEGACWIDTETATVKVASVAAPPATLERPKADAAYPVTAVGYGWKAASGEGPVSPLLTKIYQESGLRQASNTAAVNPATAQALGLEEGCEARVESRAGSATLRIALDPGVMPGAVRLSCGPSFEYSAGAADPADASVLCKLGDTRTVPVRLSRA